MLDILKLCDQKHTCNVVVTINGGIGSLKGGAHANPSETSRGAEGSA